MPNSCLHNEAFTGTARIILRCSYCQSDNHMLGNCLANLVITPAWDAQPPVSQRPTLPEVCWNFNDGRCGRSPTTQTRHLPSTMDCGKNRIPTWVPSEVGRMQHGVCYAQGGGGSCPSHAGGQVSMHAHT